MVDQIWSMETGESPLVATAVHDGHQIREELQPFLALDEPARLREEDPYTGVWTEVAPTRIVGLRSRFEVDLNRPREKAVYRTPEDAWGLQVWQPNTPPELFDRSLDEYDSFYQSMKRALTDKANQCGRFVVFDLHTYNHRREGSNGPPADPEANPQVNIGTGTMDRQRWAPVVDAFIDQLRAYDFPGGKLDVRENVKFRGGNWPRWIHETFPTQGVAIAIEFKKWFMDEWTGQADPALVQAIKAALESTVQPVLAALESLE